MAQYRSSYQLKIQLGRLLVPLGVFYILTLVFAPPFPAVAGAFGVVRYDYFVLFLGFIVAVLTCRVFQLKQVVLPKSLLASIAMLLLATLVLLLLGNAQKPSDYLGVLREFLRIVNYGVIVFVFYCVCCKNPPMVIKAITFAGILTVVLQFLQYFGGTAFNMAFAQFYGANGNAIFYKVAIEASKSGAVPGNSYFSASFGHPGITGKFLLVPFTLSLWHTIKSFAEPQSGTSSLSEKPVFSEKTGFFARYFWRKPSSLRQTASLKRVGQHVAPILPIFLYMGLLMTQSMGSLIGSLGIVAVLMGFGWRVAGRRLPTLMGVFTASVLVLAIFTGLMHLEGLSPLAITRNITTSYREKLGFFWIGMSKMDSQIAVPTTPAQVSPQVSPGLGTLASVLVPYFFGLGAWQQDLEFEYSFVFVRWGMAGLVSYALLWLGILKPMIQRRGQFADWQAILSLSVGYLIVGLAHVVVFESRTFPVFIMTYLACAAIGKAPGNEIWRVGSWFHSHVFFDYTDSCLARP